MTVMDGNLLLGTVLTTSLAGSLHCVGMCGPLVGFATGVDQRLNGNPWFTQIAYHGGRLVTYALVGVVCGLIGAALDLGGSAVGLQRAAAYIAGGTMIVLGLAALLHQLGVRFARMRPPRWLQSLLNVGHRSAAAMPPVPRALVIGLITAFLPCGWLYAFAIVAAGTASPLWGGLVMIAFWAGSVPVLAAVGVGVERFTRWTGANVNIIMSVAVVVLGAYMIVHRVNIDPAKLATHAAAMGQNADSAIQHVESLDDQLPPCCRHGE